MKIYSTDDAPGFAKHSSTFKNDERCVEVHFVVGSDYDGVAECVRSLALEDTDIVDYDVNYSTEGDAYVGVTCRDI